MIRHITIPVPKTAQDAQEYIAESARALSIFAEKNGLTDLQYLLDMVVLAADHELYEIARQHAEALKRLDDDV